MSKSNSKHLERIKENIDKSADLSPEEKSNSMKHIEEWYAEDQAWGTFINELARISPKVEAILAELGLI
ncbi:hypothetical protein MNB_SV-10-977 [hydrothermal vent metagenome]|uniref:Uncharacterized protein n=1 Tax=hydrothermal vent metagenome TaxID=652676 RepID=A0A1W1BY56_9ZZZZ